ncbi:hypothetical protein LJR175_008196 [Variovorax sp. LjRoot175]|uniref:hypothetical protein n=1 Tax=Variovorax sp. LjRoot175 TaxID=3342276 RepID=UPI003ED00C80
MNRTEATAIQAQVVGQLISRGWYADRVCRDVASRDYDTAAGGRTAVIYCRPSSDHPGNHLLTAEYWSEGNNALSTSFATIPAGLDEAAVRGMVDDYAAAVDATIRQTYAMRIKALMADEIGEEDPVAEEDPPIAPRATI